MKKYAVVYSDGSHTIYEAPDICEAAEMAGNDDNVVAIILHPVVGIHRGLHYAVAEMALAGELVRPDLGGGV